MSTRQAPSGGELIPALLVGLIDDAAVFPPGSAGLPEALEAHRGHRAAWYADLIGPLLLPALAVPAATSLVAAAGPVAGASPTELGVVGDSGLEPLASAIGRAGPRLRVRQIEIAVAKRGEDPQPGLRRLIDRLAGWPGITGYAELPLTWGLLSSLDIIAEARDGGLDIAPKFRVGGLAAELFPTPVELAAVICACRDRRLPFKLTAGLHNAVRHIDPETGFIHHGFLNILVGAAVAGDGAEVAEVAEVLGGTDTAALTEAGRARRHQQRPLWVGFGSCSIVEPLTDLIRLGMIDGGYE